MNARRIVSLVAIVFIVAISLVAPKNALADSPWFGQGCNTSYTGPNGLRAGGYSPQSLTQDQRQWLFEVFGNAGIAPDGYGGQGCPWQNQPAAQPTEPPWFGQGCGTSYTGPGGLRAGGYSPQSLSQDQRQWLFEVFGNAGIASDGYGGQGCDWQNQPTEPPWFGQGCGTSYTGPGGLRAGGYSPQSLSQDQRQWLFEVFGNAGIASDGYGGQGCDWQNQPATQSTEPPWFDQGCGTSYTGPGGISAGGYSPQNLSQDQRQWLFEVFGHNGTAPDGYGGEDCGNNQSAIQQSGQESQPEPTQTPYTPFGFSSRDVIQIGNDVYVIVTGNQYNEKRLVPDSATLDALGISSNMINNKGFSKRELDTIPQGPDVPNVNSDNQGFVNFKNSYFPNTSPIQTIGAQSSSQSNGTIGGQTLTDQALPGDGYDPGREPCSNGIQVCASSAEDLFDPGQCTSYVASLRQDVALWIGDVPRHAYLWADRARANGVQYGVYVGSTPQVGDIAVWDKADANGSQCAGANPDYGHVAYVYWASGSTFKVQEHGWSWDRTNSPITVEGCMSFIRLPVQQSAQSSSGTSSDNATNIFQQIRNFFINLWNSISGK